MPKEFSPQQKEELFGIQSSRNKPGKDEVNQELMGTVYAEWMSETGATPADVNAEIAGKKIQ